MVLWSALLTMGVIRPLGVATAKHWQWKKQWIRLLQGPHTEFTSGINWEWVRYAQIQGIHRTKYSCNMGYPQLLHKLPINAHHTISGGVQPYKVSLWSHFSHTRDCSALASCLSSALPEDSCYLRYVPGNCTHNIMYVQYMNVSFHKWTSASIDYVHHIWCM